MSEISERNGVTKFLGFQPEIASTTMFIFLFSFVSAINLIDVTIIIIRDGATGSTGLTSTARAGARIQPE